jgi:hypothetical protein
MPLDRSITFQISKYMPSNIEKIQGTEFLMIFQRIQDVDATDALEYVNNHFEKWTIEGHLPRYGKFDRLNPVDYHSYFTLLTR